MEERSGRFELLRPAGRRTDLAVGDKVMITARGMRGQTGTLVKPTRLPNLKRAWSIQLDEPNLLTWHGRTVVAEWALQKVGSPST